MKKIYRQCLVLGQIMVFALVLGFSQEAEAMNVYYCTNNNTNIQNVVIYGWNGNTKLWGEWNANHKGTFYKTDTSNRQWYYAGSVSETSAQFILHIPNGNQSANSVTLTSSTNSDGNLWLQWDTQANSSVQSLAIPTFPGATPSQPSQVNSFNIYVRNTANANACPYLYAWYQNSNGATHNVFSAFPGITTTKTVTDNNGVKWFVFPVSAQYPVKLILSNGTASDQSANYETGLTSDAFLEWSGTNKAAVTPAATTPTLPAEKIQFAQGKALSKIASGQILTTSWVRDRTDASTGSTGSISTTLSTITLKSDQLQWDSNNQFKFKLKDPNGKTFKAYADYVFPFSNNAKWEKYNNCNTNDHWFILTKDANKTSYTIMANSGTTAYEYKKSNVVKDESIAAGGILVEWNKSLTEDASHKYYLVGNTTNVNSGANWSPNKLLPMDRIVYGYYDDQDVAHTDSVCYRVMVPKPANGFGDLFLGIMEGSKFTTTSFGQPQWDALIRPLVHPNKDAEAHEGGLYFGSDGYHPAVGSDAYMNNSQSLNPKINNEDKYDSYILTINLKTCTYWIKLMEKEKSLKIIGPAAKVYKKDASGSVSSTATGPVQYANKKDAIPLDFDETEGCWKNDVHLTQGQDFMFIFGDDFRTCYGEDSGKPGWDVLSSSQNGNQLASNGIDTQYFNFLHQNEGLEDLDDEGGIMPLSMEPFYQKILFTLPTGDYVLRFFKKQVAGDEMQIFYTLERKWKLLDLTDRADNLGAYKSFSTWSDWNAYEKPADVDVFYVSGFTANTDQSSNVQIGGTATLTKLDIDYVPAQMGVILASKQGKDAADDYYKNITLKVKTDEPQKTYALSDGATNYLSYCVQSRSLAGTERQDAADQESDITYRNYVFGYFKKPSWTNYKVGFWRLRDGDCSETYSYLHLPASVSGGTLTGTYDTPAFTQQNSPRIRLAFEDEDMGTTDISGITDKGAETTSAASQSQYFNLQGMRISKPSKSGIYITNSRKIIVK